ncbi:MAG: hypothetical protein SXA11_15800 [Cyanobacteriota bacterium]|nr:hypothetical protein [Cyanobacteriota bacterium]
MAILESVKRYDPFVSQDICSGKNGVIILTSSKLATIEVLVIFDGEVNFIKGLGGMACLNAEPNDGTIFLTGTSDELVGGPGPEILDVPTAGADNYDNIILSPGHFSHG